MHQEAILISQNRAESAGALAADCGPTKRPFDAIRVTGPDFARDNGRAGYGRDRRAIVCLDAPAAAAYACFGVRDQSEGSGSVSTQILHVLVQFLPLCDAGAALFLADHHSGFHHDCDGCSACLLTIRVVLRFCALGHSAELARCHVCKHLRRRQGK